MKLKTKLNKNNNILWGAIKHYNQIKNSSLIIFTNNSLVPFLNKYSLLIIIIFKVLLNKQFLIKVTKVQEHQTDMY
jgi:hypothetical protein